MLPSSNARELWPGWWRVDQSVERNRIVNEVRVTVNVLGLVA